MIIYNVALLLCISLLIQGGKVGGQNVNRADLQDSQEPAFRIRGISKEDAISIANNDALRSYNSLAEFNIIACETGLFWYVIYDGGGPEYVINKTSGAIMSVRRIPQAPAGGNGQEGAVQRNEGISEQEAIEIARRDASASAPGEDMRNFAIYTCELARVWRVIIEFRLEPEVNQNMPVIPFASTPNYVIDKRTGEIIYKQRN